MIYPALYYSFAECEIKTGSLAAGLRDPGHRVQSCSLTILCMLLAQQSSSAGTYRAIYQV